MTKPTPETTLTEWQQQRVKNIDNLREYANKFSKIQDMSIDQLKKWSDFELKIVRLMESRPHDEAREEAIASFVENIDLLCENIRNRSIKTNEEIELCRIWSNDRQFLLPPEVKP